MESKIIELDNMKKADLKKPSKSQVTKLLLKQNFEPERAVPKPRIKPIPTPRKNVKQMVQEFEDNIIPPPVKLEMGENQPKNPKQKRMLCQLQHQGQKMEEKSKAISQVDSVPHYGIDWNGP